MNIDWYMIMKYMNIDRYIIIDRYMNIDQYMIIDRYLNIDRYVIMQFLQNYAIILVP